MALAILDDYQNCALSSADWSAVRSKYEITVFNDTLPAQEPPSEALIDRLKPFDVIVSMRERTPFPASLLTALPNLRLLCTTGYYNRAIDVKAAKEHDIIVCGTGSSGDSTTEHTWALILGLARNIALEDRLIRSGIWQQTIGLGLHGKTLALLGLGNFGKRSARVGKMFGMKVIAWSPNLTEERCQEEGIEFAGSKASLFLNADVLSIHMALSERTKGLVSREDLRRMKSTALLVNTSRGPLVDEEALLEVLQQKAIAGAALDVYSVEPLPNENAFTRLDNTLLTPHLVSLKCPIPCTK